VPDHENQFDQSNVVVQPVGRDGLSARVTAAEAAATVVKQQFSLGAKPPAAPVERHLLIVERAQIKPKTSRSSMRMVDTFFRVRTSTGLRRVLEQKTAFCRPIIRSFDLDDRYAGANAIPVSALPGPTRSPRIRLPVICGSRPYFPGAP
jgi:hypothetical protein